MREDRRVISIEVDGQTLPAPLSGHPVLEFTNTWAGWNSPPGAGGDYLTSYDVLLTLAAHHDLLTEDQVAVARAGDPSPAERETVLRQARRLRGIVYVLLIGGASDPARRSFGVWAEEARSAQRWVVHDDGTYGWRLDPRQPLRLPLLALADAAAGLLTDGPREAVHACPGKDCGWLFLDPRGRRRWCSMAVCGNRAKARAHAQRGKRS
jgi:predicted RNA-binding Zn ribbon-like protein